MAASGTARRGEAGHGKAESSVIPGVWTGVVLVLGTYRCVRLIGWDEWPYIVRLRKWVTGQNTRRKGEAIYGTEVWFTRPVLAKFLHCAWCQGFWTGCVVYVVWLYEPTAVLYALAPFALNTVVGLISTRLDQ